MSVQGGDPAAVSRQPDTVSRARAQTDGPGTTGEIIEGLWRFEALLPEWTENTSGEDGWEQQVAWWVIGVPDGLVVIDPLVDDWDELDQLVRDRGGCAGVVRTCHWHQRSVAEVANRYSAEVWAKQHTTGAVSYASDHPLSEGVPLFGELRVFDVERDDEIAVWLSRQAALVFGDAMIRTPAGDLRVCPESWTQPKLRAVRRGSVPCSAISQHCPLSTSWYLTVRSCWAAEARPCRLPHVDRGGRPPARSQRRSWTM